jgi:hypothetical protein
LKIHHRGTEDTEEGDFSLAGRRRPGKRASASGESSSFLRASLGVPPFGRVPGLPDRRLPIGQKNSSLCALRVSVVSKNAGPHPSKTGIRKREEILVSTVTGPTLDQDRF